MHSRMPSSSHWLNANQSLSSSSCEMSWTAPMAPPAPTTTIFPAETPSEPEALLAVTSPSATAIVVEPSSTITA